MTTSVTRTRVTFEDCPNPDSEDPETPSYDADLEICENYLNLNADVNAGSPEELLVQLNKMVAEVTAYLSTP